MYEVIGPTKKIMQSEVAGAKTCLNEVTSIKQWRPFVKKSKVESDSSQHLFISEETGLKDVSMSSQDCKIFYINKGPL